MTSPAPFTGLLAYPITPLRDDGAPDLSALARLVGRAVDAEADGIVVLASSGAGTSFRAKERDHVVRAAVDAAARTPVHVAVSAASTPGVLRAAMAAEDAGASGLVLAPFSYVPLVDAEVEALFAAVAGVTALPVCFYNKPMQTGYDLGVDAFAALVADGLVSAVKDPASLPTRPHGRVDELRRAAARLDGRRAAVGLSGDVAMLDDVEVADAWHTGLAALAPQEYVAVRRALVAGEPDTVAEQHTWLSDLAAVLATLRPVSGLHALANLLGVETAPPRGPLLPVPFEGVGRLRSIVDRRP